MSNTLRYPVDNWQAWYDAQPYGTKTDYGYHDGADLNLKSGGDTDLGQPLHALADGVVTSIHSHTTIPTFGNHIHIQHDGPWGTIWSHFAHCDRIVVQVGQEVKQGDIVAYLGKSGTTQAHCHWAIKLQPTGIDAVAHTTDDLMKWTDPIKFVGRWSEVPSNQGALTPETQPATQPSAELKYTEDQMTALREERDKNWNLYQDALRDLDDVRGQLTGCKNDYNTFLEYLAEKLTTIVDVNAIKGALERILSVEEQLRVAQKALDEEKAKHLSDISDLQTQITQLKTEVQKQQKENQTLITRLEKLEEQATGQQQQFQTISWFEQLVTSLKGAFSKKS